VGESESMNKPESPDSGVALDENHYETGASVGCTYSMSNMARNEMPNDEMPREVAYRMIQDDLTIDVTPARKYVYIHRSTEAPWIGVLTQPLCSLGSFVTTHMEHEAEELMANMLSKNIVNHESYPGTTNIQNRCVNMIARLFNAPIQEGSVDAVGTSTVGSSEAIMLATLAMKKRWANKRRAVGKDWSKPNLIMSSAVQVCWKKAARYFDIEEKYVYCTKDRYTIDPDEAVGLVDENTIGICSIMGTTYTGEYEDTKAINDLLVKRHLDVPIHIDAASGGFVAPFVNPDLIWDFRLDKVASINVSGHKYGLVYAGIGWVIWRGAEYLPKGELCSLPYFLIFNLTVLSCQNLFST
jgi:glutamate decarboxylase